MGAVLDHGIDAIECYHSAHPPAFIEDLVACATDRGIPSTVGGDSHGTESRPSPVAWSSPPSTCILDSGQNDSLLMLTEHDHPWRGPILNVCSMNGWRPLLERHTGRHRPTFEHGRVFAIALVPAFSSHGRSPEACSIGW